MEAHIKDPAQIYTFAPAPGGALLLNRIAFGFPGFGQPGNSGRKARITSKTTAAI